MLASSFKDEYINLLEKRTFEEKITDNVVRITTPLLDRNNDAIEIYIIQKSKHLELTDDGSTIYDLSISGLEFKKNTMRYKYLHDTVANYGVSIGSDNQLLINATKKDYAIKMHMLTQCMIKVSELFVLNKPTIKSIFKEDVKKYFDSNDIRYVEDVYFVGKSNLSTYYDFAIPASKTKSERIIKTTNNITLNYAQTTVFGWEDTKPMRKKDSKLYVIFDDKKNKISENTDLVLSSYGVMTIPWKDIDKYKDELSA